MATAKAKIVEVLTQEEAIEKARAAGLTEDELALIKRRKETKPRRPYKITDEQLEARAEDLDKAYDRRNRLSEKIAKLERAVFYNEVMRGMRDPDPDNPDHAEFFPEDEMEEYDGENEEEENEDAEEAVDGENEEEEEDEGEWDN